jgi:hypothetical protein
MKIQFAGRRVKYLPENADLFCKILELKDEGYSNEDIRGILKVSNSESLKVEPSDGLDIEISDGLDICSSIPLAISLSKGISDDLTVYISDHLSEGLDISSSYDLSGGISDPLSGAPSDLLACDLSDPPSEGLSDLLACDLDDLSSEGMDKDALEQTGADEGNPVCPDSDRDGLAHSGADVAAQIQAGMDQARKASLKEAEVLIESLLTEQAGQLEGILQKMATQSNIAITALCEASEDIRKSILALDTRLSRMEKGLDMEEADPLELYQVAAENYQVDLPEISPLMFQSRDQDQDPEDDLAPVRNSITDGIPDREKAVEWILARREEDLQAGNPGQNARNSMDHCPTPSPSPQAGWMVEHTIIIGYPMACL